jgi:hypothetical protein
MNATPKGGFAVRRLLDYAARLRFPKLLVLTGILFLADLVVPDAIPFIDEILLGLGATLLAMLKKRRAGAEEAGGSQPPNKERPL